MGPADKPVVKPKGIVRMTRTEVVRTGPKSRLTLKRGDRYAVHSIDAGHVRLHTGIGEAAQIVKVPRSAVRAEEDAA
jgi:hypothetical protein